MIGRLKRNISALPDATVLLNHHFEIEWCNEPAHYLLNIHARFDQGQHIGNLIRDPVFLAYLQSPDELENVEISSPHDQALSVQLKVVQYGDNQYLLSARDVSNQRRFQDGLKNFVANASHELKSPLTLISGHLELLEAETNLSTAGLHSLQTAQRQGQRMRNLIEDLLLLSQVESYQLQPDEGENLLLVDIMAVVQSSLNPDMDLSRLTFDTATNLRLRGVKSEIEGICFNLVENALKYAIPDSPIEVSWNENLLGEFCFSVRDQGPGIEATELEHITRRYYRARNSSGNQIEGSGLGLAIVKQATAKHGGILEIDSAVGKGSRFSVSFPSYRCSHQASAKIFRLGEG